jgi:hypothetical protein
MFGGTLGWGRGDGLRLLGGEAAKQSNVVQLTSQYVRI